MYFSILYDSGLLFQTRIFIGNSPDKPFAGTFFIPGNGEVIARFGFHKFGIFPVNAHILHKFKGIKVGFTFSVFAAWRPLGII